MLSRLWPRCPCVKLEFGPQEMSPTYTGLPWPLFLKISGAMYPGVPQVVVSTWNCSSSIILESPKSAISKSALSSGVLNNRFSGLRSR